MRKTKPIKRTRAGDYIISTVAIPSIFGDYEYNVAVLDQRGNYLEEIGASHDKRVALRVHERAVRAAQGTGPEVRRSLSTTRNR